MRGEWYAFQVGVLSGNMGWAVLGILLLHANLLLEDCEDDTQEAEDVKLIVVACNSATSAALPQLQEELTVPIVGVALFTVANIAGRTVSGLLTDSTMLETFATQTHSMPDGKGEGNDNDIGDQAD